MKYAAYETEYGFFKIGYENETVLYLKKQHEKVESGERNDFTNKVYNQLLEYFAGERKDFTFKYEISGTEFQKKVYNALLNIKYGEVKTYRDVAIEIGNSKASRAVGNANNKNPLTIIYPCHRVIGSNKKLVGYAGGLDMKEKILKLEKDNKHKFEK